MPDREGCDDWATDVQICARCGIVTHAHANFCVQCGWMLTAGANEPPAVGAYAPDRRRLSRLSSPFERRQLTVMFCDLVNSTSLASRSDPEDLNDAFADFYRVVRESVAQFGGYVARYLGDGALVYFGYPDAHEDDAERAVHAALETQRRVKTIERMGRPPQTRIGIATGIVVVGNLHAGTLPATLDVAGEAAHIAARLQGIARPDAVLVTANTRAMIGELFEWRELGARKLKGIASPIEVWQVLAARAVSSRFEALRGKFVSPMLARDEQHAKLLSAWDAASNRQGHAMLVHGDPGVGKSRLAASIEDDVAKASGKIFRFCCSPTRKGSAFHPCIVFLERVADFARGDADKTRFAKLRNVLVGASAEDVALIAELLGVKQEMPKSLATLSPQAKRQRTMQVLLSQLERHARQKPTLIVFEDAHWSDESSLVLLEQLVDRLAGLPLLLLVLARPEFRPPWITRVHASEIQLDPLTEEMSAALVHVTAAGYPLSPRLVADIVKRTDGLPLFIEEVTRAIVENEEARGEFPSFDRDDGVLPFSLQASLIARLDRLGRARDIAQVASAIGREFTGDLLRLVADPDHDLEALLESLVASGILLRSDAGKSNYVFKHALIRDAAHALMNRDKRHAIHSRIAAALELHDPGVVQNNPEVLAWHYTEARVIDKAVDHWLRAGHQSLRRSAMTEALGHLRCGQSLVAELEDTPLRRQYELDLTIATGMAQIATQGYAVSSTGDTFRKAQALCDRLVDPPQTLAVMHGLWTHALMRADFPAALCQVDEVLRRSAERDDPVWALMGHRFRGSSRYFLGQFPQALADIDACLAIYDPAHRARYATVTVDDTRVVMLLYRAWTLMCMGRINEANQCCDTALREARQIGHVYTIAHALSGRAFVTLTTGSPSEALQKVDELEAALADNGIAYYDAIATIFRGWCMSAMGCFDAGLPLLVRGLTAYRAAGTTLYVSGFLRMLAECHCRAGRLDDATSLIEEAVEVMDSTWQCWDAAEIHRIRGMVRLARHESGAAEESLRRAVEVAHKQGAALWEVRASADLAALLRRRGAFDESRRLLSGLASPDSPCAPATIERTREILDAAN